MGCLGLEAQEHAAAKYLIRFNNKLAAHEVIGAWEAMTRMFTSTYLSEKANPNYHPILKSVREFMDENINVRFQKLCVAKGFDDLSVCAAATIAVKYLLETKLSGAQNAMKFDMKFKKMFDQLIGEDKRKSWIHMHKFLITFCKDLIKVVVDTDDNVIGLTKDDLDQKWAKKMAPSKTQLAKKLAKKKKLNFKLNA